MNRALLSGTALHEPLNRTMFFFEAYVDLGAWIFFVGSLVYLVVTVHDLVEVRHHWRIAKLTIATLSSNSRPPQATCGGRSFLSQAACSSS